MLEIRSILNETLFLALGMGNVKLTLGSGEMLTRTDSGWALTGTESWAGANS